MKGHLEVEIPVILLHALNHAATGQMITLPCKTNNRGVYFHAFSYISLVSGVRKVKYDLVVTVSSIVN